MAIDNQWDNVSLLLPFSESMLDVKGHTVTPVGGAALSSAVGDPFGAGNALYLDGVDDYLSLSDSPNWDLSNVNFAIEQWVRFVSHASDSVLISQRDLSTINHSFTLEYSAAASGLRFRYTTDGTTLVTVDRTWSPTNGVWYFVSAERVGTLLRLKVGATQLGADYTIGTAMVFNSTSNLRIGATNTTPAGYLNGYIGPTRLTKAGRTIALPTGPFPRPTIKGIVLDASAAPAAKVVKAFKRSTMLLTGEAISNGSTGLYTIYPSDFTEHVVVRFDTATTPLVDGGSGEVALNYDRVIPGG